MKTERVPIAIVGGGIGGLTLAISLQRLGLECIVLEQAPRLTPVGAGIQISPNAVRILEDLGMAEHLQHRGVRPQAIEMRRWEDGGVLRELPLGDCQARYGAAYLTFHRADLHHSLMQMLSPDIVHLGGRCRGLEERSEYTRLHLTDGGFIDADVVIGADGIHSVVREALVRDAPRSSGQTIYRGVVPSERLPFLVTVPKVVLWVGPGQHCVCYPIAGGEMIAFGATVPSGDWHTESWSAAGRPEDLLASYTGWNDEVKALLSAPDSVSRWALHDRDTVTNWTNRRVTILGDAAHPLLPFFAQGANQAIEDAAVLATCLRHVNGNGPSPALEHYAALRRPRTAEIHRISRQNEGTLHLPDGPEQRGRDDEWGHPVDLASMDWLYGYDATAAASAGGK